MKDGEIFGVKSNTFIAKSVQIIECKSVPNEQIANSISIVFTDWFTNTYLYEILLNLIKK